MTPPRGTEAPTPPTSDESPSPLIAAALAQLAEGVIVTDAAGRITFVNEAAAALHGVARLDVSVDDYSATYHLFTEEGEPYPPTDLPLARAVLRGETVVDARWRIRRPDGTAILATGSARPVFGRDGRQVGAVLTIRDDTAREAAAAAERERTALAGQLRNAFEQSPVSTVVYDAAGHPIAVNPAFERLWGVGLADVPNGYSVLTDPQLEAAGVLPLLRSAFGLDGARSAHGPGEAVTLPALRYDVATTTGRGSTLWTQAHAYPVRDAAGAVERVILSHDDITEDRRVAAALSEATGTLQMRNTHLQEQALELEQSNQQLQDQTVELEAQTAELRAIATELEERTAEAQEAQRTTDAERARAADTAAALRASESQFRTLADAIPTLAWTARADGFIDWYNARWYEYTGTTPADMEGWGWQSVHDPRMLPLVLERWTGAIATGQSFEMVFPLRGADGKFRQFLTRISPIVDATGRVVRWFGTNADVDAERSARDSAERTVQRIERLQTLTSGLARARTVDDVAGVIVAQAAAATGATTAALTMRVPGTDDAILVEQKGLSAAILANYARFPLTMNGPSAECLRTGHAIFIESRDGPEGLLARFPMQRQAVEEVGAHALATIPLSAAGETVGALSFTFDTAREFAEVDRDFFLSLGHQSAQAVERARLFDAESAARAAAEQARTVAEEANQAKMDFLATMSHELRTPLNAIGGYAELIALDIHGPTTDQQREALGRIQRSQRHLLGLINDVLNFAKLEAGRVEYDITEVQVGAVFDAIEPLIAPQLRAKSIRFSRDMCSTDESVRADPEKLRQILVNLLSNAIKFTLEGGSIALRCNAMQDVVALSVEDTGIGVAADRLDHIFDPFVQIDRRLNAPHEGTGLGLAISRDLAHGMSGELKVRSVPGRGSTFTLTLPVGRKDARPAHAPVLPEGGLRPRGFR